MMNLRKFYLIIVFILPLSLFSQITVEVSDYAIYNDANAGYISQYASKELQKHLSLILKKETKIIHKRDNIDNYSYIFYVGTKDPNDKDTLKKEECRYSIYKTKTYIYGTDSRDLDSIDDVLNIYAHSTGTLYGVYKFLKNEIGVDWISPGNSGIVYPDLDKLQLNEKKYSWQPPIAMRDMWQRAYGKRMRHNKAVLPPQFNYINKDFILKRNKTESAFFRRMFLGRRRNIGSHHSYSDYWEKYKNIHPNWFALNEHGKREPLTSPKYVKMCLTADGLADHVIDKWHKKWLNNTEKILIKASENDGEEGFCRCDKCKALDANTKAEDKLKWDLRSKSDRYVWYWNQLAEKAKKYTDKALVTVYLYSSYRYYPHKERLSPMILGGFVPRFYDDPDLVRSTIDGWFKMGLKHIFIRPNDFNDDIGLPTGNEKYMFDRFHNSYIVSKKYNVNVLAVSYDRAYSYNDYEVNGIAFYVIVNSISYPEKSFDEIVNRYYMAYGPAKEKIKQFFEYWRNELFYKRRYPDRDKVIGFEGRDRSFANVSKYYHNEDFEITFQYLEDALKTTGLREQEKYRINKLKWDLQCKYAEYKAICEANNLKGNSENLVNAVNNMCDLRYKYRDKIFCAWHKAFEVEDNFGDATGYKRSRLYENLNFRQLPAKLRFKIDPDNSGVRDKWYSLSAEQIEQKWTNFIDITINWEAGKGDLDAALKEKLKKYDGYAWYNIILNKDIIADGKKHYLMFGAVDESCWIYVNGKLTGERIFSDPNDWQMPFKIRIDQAFIEGKNQNIIIRVQDKSLAGGIWKRVSLGVEK